ncbi:MAG: class I adenylate-forming enzyme family protein [Proteobacteria bacterium]|nr:class I adenylate-forming enzyme family protein [Pseudomonadota bacterium]
MSSFLRLLHPNPPAMMLAMHMLIGEIFRRNAEVVPDAVAASMGTAVLTHGQLDRAGNQVAHVLRELGVERGDRVVSWADTCLEMLPLFVGLAKLGAVFAPVNARLGVEEATEVVARARPRLLVADPAHGEAAALVAKNAGVVLTAHVGGAAGGPGTDLDAAARTAPGDEPETPGLVETDTHVLFFTSGSTGRPKGVVLSHRANSLRTFQGVFRDEPERSVCMFPLFHMAAFTLGLAAWQTRGEIAFVESATAEEILSAVERRRANRLYCIPAVWARILEADPDRWDTSSLREIDTGTSATPIELVRALKERFPGTVTRINYGSTEVGSAATLPDADVLRKPGSVGPPSPGVDLALTDEGEIRVRSAYLFDGYFDDPEATSAALVDGWFHTGDIGALDDEGYLQIVGRLKEVIRTGGESVAPSEVEQVLASHPALAEVAVVGVPDLQWGELVCAVAVDAGTGVARPSLEDLQKHCEGRLAGFKKPRRLEWVEALPRTAATGQVQRTLLVEQIATR